MPTMLREFLFKRPVRVLLMIPALRLFTPDYELVINPEENILSPSASLSHNLAGCGWVDGLVGSRAEDGELQIYSTIYI